LFPSASSPADACIQPIATGWQQRVGLVWSPPKQGQVQVYVELKDESGSPQPWLSVKLAILETETWFKGQPYGQCGGTWKEKWNGGVKISCL